MSANPKITGSETVVPQALGEDLMIMHIPLEEIDFQDTTFCFRAILRVNDLVGSLRQSGQQIPVVVRPGRDGGYQLISGFRRATALSELGAQTIAAYVRYDLMDDVEAFKASVLENMARKTYSDLDRAYVIKRYHDLGYKGFKVAELMQLTKRQKNNLRSLLDFPTEVQEAIIAEGSKFTTTHALQLKELRGTYRRLDYQEWIRRVNEEGLSISQLVRAVNAAYHSKVKEPMTLIRARLTDFEGGVIAIKSVCIKVSDLSAADRKNVRQELEQMLAML